MATDAEPAVGGAEYDLHISKLKKDSEQGCDALVNALLRAKHQLCLMQW